jgi:hypothetical protein
MPGRYCVDLCGLGFVDEPVVNYEDHSAMSRGQRG